MVVADMSHRALLHARDRVNGHFAAAGAGKLPFADNSFDKVIFADVIEHVPDDSMALRRSCVAKAGAVIVISTLALEGVFTETWLKTSCYWEEEDEFQKN